VGAAAVDGVPLGRDGGAARWPGGDDDGGSLGFPRCWDPGHFERHTDVQSDPDPLRSLISGPNDRPAQTPAAERPRPCPTAPQGARNASNLHIVISTNQLKNGNHIEVDGTIFKVVEFQHVKPGKGPAFVRTKLRRTKDGNLSATPFRAGEKFRSVRTEARKMTFLYGDGTDAHFMDAETFEQTAIPETALADKLRWTKANETVDLLFIDGEPADIQLPSSVELEITFTEPGVRGDTASGGGNKPATVETGAEIQVPLFVNVGDRVKVQTETGEYMSRA
jgi:elongation factor P